LIDIDDEHFLRERRWRVWPTRPRCRAKLELKSGPHGLPLQRMVMAGAKVVRFRDGNGLDCRRENLVAMTKQELAEEWRARKAAAQKERDAAKAAA
jgi:HNH endonuclease